MDVIYGIENLIDHKIYVGQTIVKLETRIAKHKSADTLLGRAIRKYGWDGNFIYITETRRRKPLALAMGRKAAHLPFFKYF